MIGCDRPQPGLACEPFPLRGFTLIELVVVMGVLSLLMSMVLPSLNQARERGRVSVCLANAHSINAAMTMYASDDDANLPWFYIYSVDEACNFETYPGATGFTSFSWGGMLPPPSRGLVDSQVTPVPLRPFNRYLAPEARGYDVLKVYVCPSDTSAANPSFHGGGAIADPDAGVSNWQSYGTSYSVSWHWLRAYAGERPQLANLEKRLMWFGGRMLHDARGGAAARMVWMSENHMDQMLNVAGSFEPGSPPGIQGEGWHGRYSVHTAFFLDGHAEHRYFDTRFRRGDAWTTLAD